MARGFGSANYLLASSSPITSLPITMACWGRSTQAAAQSVYFAIGKQSGLNRHQLAFAGDAAGDPIRITSVSTGGSSAFASSNGTNGLNLVLHAAATVSSTNSRKAYFNGVAGSDNTTNIDSSDSTFDYISIGTRFASGVAGLPHSGWIAWPAVWNVALSADEIAALAAGYSPLLIRPQNLVFFAPLQNEAAGDEFDIVGGRLLTETGTVTYEHDEFRSIYPRRRSAIVFPPGAAPSYTHPTLSAVTATEITATSFKPRVTYEF